MSLSISLDPITRKKLVLVKQLFNQSQDYTLHPYSNVNRILAVIGFDLCTETVLNAVDSVLNPNQSPETTFQNLVKEAERLLAAQSSALPDKANIQHVHKIRNSAQHKATYPNDNDVSDCRTYIRDFLTKIIREVWNESFDNISLVDLVQHQRIRKWLAGAERAFSRGDYDKAVFRAGNALIWTTALVNNHMRVGNLQLCLNLGIPFPMVMQFVGIIGEQMLGHYGQIDDFERVNRPVSASDAGFVLHFCIDSVIQIETAVGDMNAPFGRSKWWFA